MIPSKLAVMHLVLFLGFVVALYQPVKSLSPETKELMAIYTAGSVASSASIGFGMGLAKGFKITKD